MELTVETLEAKRQQCLDAVKSHEAAMNANYGALQVLDEMIAVAKAVGPKTTDKIKKE